MATKDFTPDGPLDEQYISVRLFNVLSNEGIKTLRDLEGYTEAELLRFPNLGKVSLKEVKDACAKAGVTIGQPAALALKEVERLKRENASLRNQLAEWAEKASRLHRIEHDYEALRVKYADLHQKVRAMEVIEHRVRVAEYERERILLRSPERLMQECESV